MKKSRRDFMRVAAMSAFFAGAGPLTVLKPGEALAAEEAPAEDNWSYRQPEGGIKAKRWGMAIFTKEFNSAQDFIKVMEACHIPHNVPKIDNVKQEVKWLWPAGYHQTFTEAVPEFTSTEDESRQYLLLCNHCDNPACVRVCPTGATFKRADGIVVMDYHRCIGCRFCMAGCPYGARSFNFYNPRDYIASTNSKFPTRMRGVVEKCTFCSERLAEGKLPYCVEASDGAIVFGDLLDADSDVAKALKDNYSVVRKPSVGTRPSVYYII